MQAASQETYKPVVSVFQKDSFMQNPVMKVLAKERADDTIIGEALERKGFENGLYDKRKAVDFEMKKIRVAVVGGGASGMVAAIAASRAGAEVFLIEGNDRVGKKLLSTGNGKCNFTNRNVERIAEHVCHVGRTRLQGSEPGGDAVSVGKSERAYFPSNLHHAIIPADSDRMTIHAVKDETFHSNDLSFPARVLERFGYRETIDFFKSLGVVPKERNGGIYPAGGQASAVLDLLRLELLRQDVKVICSMKIKSCGLRVKDICIGDAQAKEIDIRDVRMKEIRSNDFYTGKPRKKNCCANKFQAGGLSALGASEFVLEGTGPDGTSSMSADRVILACGGKAAPGTGSDGSGYTLAKNLGHSVTPLSPALVQLKCQEDFYKQLSGVRTDGAVRLYVDGRLAAEDQGELQLTAYGISGIPVFQVSRFAGLALQARRRVEAELDLMPSMSQGELEAYFCSFSPECYGGLLNKKLLALLLKRYGREPGRLAAGVKTFRTRIKAVNSYENAQVTAGGVDTRQIDPCTMMSKIVPGLYFAGELIDVDGSCGGYNLQWAWSSGYVAGRSAAAFISHRDGVKANGVKQKY